MALVQVTSREFREKQASLFNLADEGKRIVIRRGKKQAYILTPIDDVDFLISDETEKKIELAKEQYKQGKGVRCKTFDDVLKHLDSL